jgi:hypothetical protein
LGTALVEVSPIENGIFATYLQWSFPMNNQLEKVSHRLSKDKEEQFETLPAERTNSGGVMDFFAPFFAQNSFLNFRYSYLEISSDAKHSHVKSRETWLHNGKLVMEECEGDIDHEQARQMLDGVQRQWMDQINTLFNLYSPFSLFLPRQNGDRREK